MPRRRSDRAEIAIQPRFVARPEQPRERVGDRRPCPGQLRRVRRRPQYYVCRELGSESLVVVPFRAFARIRLNDVVVDGHQGATGETGVHAAAALSDDSAFAKRPCPGANPHERVAFISALGGSAATALPPEVHRERPRRPPRGGHVRQVG